MDEVQQFLSETFLDASRYALHSPYLPAMHECDTDIYLVMYAYFKKRALQQKRETAISISHEEAVKLVRHVLLSNLAGQANPLGKVPKSSPSASWLEYDAKSPFGTATFPIITQRSLKEQLQMHKINCESFAEVLELCRRVEQKVAGGASNPPAFGTANVLIFVAVAMALVPSASVEAMISKLLEVSSEASLPLPLAMRVIHIWCVLDSHNRGGLQRVCDALHGVVRERAASGASQLLEASSVRSMAAVCLAGVPPMFMQGQIRFVRPQPPADNDDLDADPVGEEPVVEEELVQRPLAPPKVVTYTEEDDGVPTATVPQQRPPSPPSSDDDVVDDEGKEFWAQLAS